ncbi:MAG: exonuclease domain-containing protein [Lachnospiraceae bacterium]
MKKNQRSNKGKSLFSFPDSFTVIDIETTGLSPRFNEIIEISAIKIQNKNILDKFSSLVKPAPSADGLFVDEFITDLTGITNEMLASAPDPLPVLEKFLSFIGNDILVGHNVNFDINFLYDYCEKFLSKPLINDFVDTMRISRILHPEFSDHTLSTLCSFYSIKNSNAHRSLSDCIATAECYNFLLTDAVDRYGDVSSFLSSIKNKKKSTKCRAVNFSSNVDNIDPTNPLFGKVVVFTGTLDTLSRKQAMQIVADHGGINADSVTQKTNFLVLGCNDYCSLIKDGKSNKQKKAESLKLKGNDIEIITEDVFLDMLSDTSTNDNLSECNMLSESLQLIFKNIIQEYELPENCIRIRSNSSSKGNVTSKSIFICEPGYPDSTSTTSNFLVLNFKETAENIQLIIRCSLFHAVPFPNPDHLPAQRSDSSFSYLTFRIDDSELLDYVGDCIRYCIQHYKSSNRFGCCGLYVECSDARKCLHQNKLYSTGCSYRKNLENGKIFYGTKHQYS